MRMFILILTLSVLATAGGPAAEAAAEGKPAKDVEGYLYKRLQAYGSKSEGPRYMLQTLEGKKDVDYVIERGPRNPWDPDPVLENHINRKVVVSGTYQGNRLYIDSIRPKGTPGYQPPDSKPVRSIPLPVDVTGNEGGCDKGAPNQTRAAWSAGRAQVTTRFRTPQPCYELVTIRASQTGQTVTVEIRYDRRPGLCAQCEGQQELRYTISELKPVSDYDIRVRIDADGQSFEQGTLLQLTL